LKIESPRSKVEKSIGELRRKDQSVENRKEKKIPLLEKNLN
jgi:hypothetical protein